MTKYIKNSLLFVIPLLVYALFIVVIDPFNYLNAKSIIDGSLKEEISLHIEPHLYKMIKYENDPKKNIVIGDSRSNGLYYHFDQERWSNLSYGGASLKEIIQSFWYAAERENLDSVVIGINLMLYNKYNKRFWVEETVSRKSNFFSYAFNHYTFQSSIKLVNSYFSDEANPVETPEVHKDSVELAKREFWKMKLLETDKFFRRVEYPDEYFQQLKEISEYCEARNMSLIFWIPPTHVDYQNALEKYSLEEHNRMFLDDIRSLGDLYDFNFESSLTQEYDNFRDPVHFTYDIGKTIHKEIIDGSPQNSLFYPVVKRSE